MMCSRAPIKPYYKFVYNCATVVIHFVFLDAAHRDRRTRCRGRRRLSRTSTSLGNPASSEQCRQRRRRATTDGGRGEETDHRKKTRQCRTSKLRPEKPESSWRNRSLKNPEKDISNISREKTTTKMRQTGCLWDPFDSLFTRTFTKT